ncbi:MAG: carbamoyltransferase family protein [Bacteroidota bacterium]
MYILGINAYHGDASATLIEDGQVVLAIEEERLNRKKHCAGFPTLAIQACLTEAGITASDLDHIAISTDPSANLKKKVVYGLSRVTKIHKMLRDRLSKVGKTKDLRTEVAQALDIDPSVISAKVHHVEHHLAHMASCFLVSPFDEAAILTLDGMGDFVSSKWAHGQGTQIQTLGQIEYPHSLGYLYTAITQYLGFPYYGDEGKVMGLAPYGNPTYLDQFRKIVQVSPDTIGFELGLSYFRHHQEGIEMQWDDGAPHVGMLYSEALIDLLGPAREPGSEYTQHTKDVAQSLQIRLEEVAFDMLNKLAEETGSTALTMAGGVTLNSVLNGKIRQQTPFQDIYIHPNAGDGGTSLGAAYHVWNEVSQQRPETLEHAYLGVSFNDDEIKTALDKRGYNVPPLVEEELIPKTAQLIAEGNVVGWFQGNMEWGPRALGNRSIVVDPRKAEMKDVLNARIKKRESFRPFAPSILEDYTSEYFEQSDPVPAMLMVYNVKKDKRDVIPAVTHVDGTGRLQTVRQSHNQRYYRLIDAFREITGVPVVLNTSFNENEPIVCTPEEAIDCFERTNMDVLAIGSFIVTKDD